MPQAAFEATLPQGPGRQEQTQTRNSDKMTMDEDAAVSCYCRSCPCLRALIIASEEYVISDSPRPTSRPISTGLQRGP